MAVVQTFKQLYEICEKSKKLSEDKVVEIQRNIICHPLKPLFPKLTDLELHFELLRNGLFDSSECSDIEIIVKQLEKQYIWDFVQREFLHLKRLWKGPDIPILIYPLTKYRPTVEGIEVKKNGVSYNGALFLFLSTELVETEIKALFAHEYHHICRLAFLNKAPSKMTLKDSIVIEGMAECAVEELYGEKWLSPWTKRYSNEEMLSCWNKHFVPFLQLKGVRNHHTYLYGDGSVKYPRWIGYCLGYRIVQSFLENCGPIPQHFLYKISTNEIVAGSNYG